MLKTLVFAGIMIFAALSGVAKAAEVALDTFLYESISVGTSAAKTGTTTISNSNLDGYIYFEGYYTLEDGDCRYRTDTGTPTTSEGHLFGSGTAVTVRGLTDCRNFKAIGTTGTVTLRASYRRK